MTNMRLKKKFSNAMSEAGHNNIKDLVWKKSFKSYFDFHVVSNFMQFRFEFYLNGKPTTWLRRAIKRDSQMSWQQRAIKTFWRKISKHILFLMSFQHSFQFQANNMVETGHKKRFTYVMAEEGNKNMKDLIWKHLFRSYFLFHEISIFI